MKDQIIVFNFLFINCKGITNNFRLFRSLHLEETKKLYNLIHISCIGYYQLVELFLYFFGEGGGLISHLLRYSFLI